MSLLPVPCGAMRDLYCIDKGHVFTQGNHPIDIFYLFTISYICLSCFGLKVLLILLISGFQHMGIFSSSTEYCLSSFSYPLTEVFYFTYFIYIYISTEYYLISN